MARKKSAQTESSSSASTGAPNGRTAKPKKAAGDPSTSALIICRNKHWRYISSFHGPWLQLPPEVLESLAHSNYLAPRPQPMDAAVLFDLVKIRRHVDEATNLAVRAASGLTAAGLNSGLNGNSMMGFGGGGKLSRERKHRMRELATAKLSAAYHLDEIAASVATMQSASTLEDVAQLVLQRNGADVDARYVHFFHEKIPSRMMAQCTPLDTLNDLVAERPTDASALRTRALTRIFKDEHAAAARDLTDALAAARYLAAQHRQTADQLVLARAQQEQSARDWRDAKVSDDDQPSSLETQLLFHRAGVYLTLACAHVHPALDGLREQEEASAARHVQRAAGREPTPETPAETDARLFRAESRKQVRQNAKRALRDYLAFLSHFDYTPGISADAAEDFLRRLNPAQNGHHDQPLSRLLESSPSTNPHSEALTPYHKPPAHVSPPYNPADRSTWPKLPSPPILALSDLFSAVPPSSLPPYPPPSTPQPPTPSFAAHETLTYHPLLTDALHSLLLCHALLQTPAKEHLRHAHNAARLARICDGYPVFLAARSPARSDWIEVLRRGGNWIGLVGSWEGLCRPGESTSNSNAGQSGGAKAGATRNGGSKETAEQRKERHKHEAILEALADERVVDEESFQRAVRARELRFTQDESAERDSLTSPPPCTPSSGVTPNPANGHSESDRDTQAPGSSRPPRWSQSPQSDYPISTDRADAIARWVRDAPPLTSENNTGRKGRRRKGAAHAGPRNGNSKSGSCLDGNGNGNGDAET